MKNDYTQKGRVFVICCLVSLFSFGAFAQVGIGNIDPKSALDVNGALSLREGAALSLTNNDNQNIDLGATIYSQYRIIGPTADFNILTFLTPANVSSSDGQLLTLINTTAKKMTIIHDQGSNGNKQRRIYCPSGYNLVLEGQNSSVTLQYNTSLQRWVVIGYADIGGYGRNVYNNIGLDDTSTNSTNSNAMKDMSLTFTPKHSVVYVNFSASGTMDKGANSDAQGYAAFQIMRGNTSIAGTTTLATDRSFLGSGCSGTAFYDSGGINNDYSNNENVIYSFLPTNPGEKVSVTFSTFVTESSWDGLRVYNGSITPANLIDSGYRNFNYYPLANGAYTGTGNFTAQGLTFTSTAQSGALNFVFTSDGATTRPGWEACVTSSVGPPPSGYSLDSAWNAGFTMYPVSVTPGVQTTININWSRNGNPGLADVLRNNVSSNADRSHRSITIFD